MARGFVRNPSAFLFDEPTGMLDTYAENNLVSKLQEILKENKTLVLIAHHPPLLDLVDRIIIIDKGKIVADGPKDSVL